ALALSGALRINTTLTILDLRGNSVGKEGAAALSGALKANTTLTTLDLSENSIEDDGALGLSGALKTNTTLTTLNLKFNSIGNEGALALSGALKTNTTLTILDLSDNSVGKEGAAALSGALKANTTLTTLDLSENSIEDEGALGLSSALKTNTTLTTLNLRFNSIGNEGALALSEVLKTKTTLTILQAPLHKMTEQQIQRFRHGDAIEEFCVRVTQASTNNNSASSYYVSLEDVRDVFPQALRFKLNANPVPFLLGPDERRIEPLRIAFYPDDVLEVITGSPQSTTAVHSPAVKNLDIQPSQHHLLPSSSLPQSFSSSQGADEFEQAEVTKYGLAQNLSDIEKHLVENKEASQEMKEMRRQITNLLQEVKEHNDKVMALQLETKENGSKMMALQLEVKEKDDKVTFIQSQMLELQNQVLDKPGILQKHAHSIFTQSFELHECPIPRLFIILPVDKTT
ncbi:hypothetical protein BGZ46_001104, partial [Entomortierella lignicola]